MKTILCAGLLLLAANGAWGAKAHQHGVASMNAAVDGNTLELEFASPLEDLVGFEHAPRNDKQRKTMQAMKDRFATPQALFVTTPQAGCQASPAELELPEGNGGHADLLAVVRFQCAAPDALRGLDVRLFEAFPRLQRIKVQLALPRGQSSVELTRQKPRLDW